MEDKERKHGKKGNFIGLHNYQIAAIEKMKTGCILCGGVGSGKSRTSLAYYYMRQGGNIYSDTYTEMTDPKDLYIITTARKRDTLEWEAEFPFFLIGSDSCLYSNKVVVDSWNNIGKYKTVTDAFFIFDEQRVVGDGPWAKTFIEIARHNEWILLSATPGDKWLDYMAVFVANGFYKNITEFKRNHVIYNSFRNYLSVDRYIGTHRLVRLRNSILINMDFQRDTVSHHEQIEVSYDISKYKDVMRNRWNIFKDEPIANASEFCQVLRRIVNSAESRQLAVFEIFDKHPRMIIFYNYDYELDILKGMYFGEDVEIAEWNGHKHQPIPECRSWIYLVQYNAGSEGWNCVKTDTIIFYSQNYSYKMMVQASGRIDRMNTPFKDLYYYHLKSRSGIDLAITKALKIKKKFNEDAFAGHYFK